MNLWDQDTYTKTWNFASEAHIDQLVPGTKRAYINHIGNVVMEIMSAIVISENIADPNLSVQCALLHDVIEDTEKTYADISNTFSIAVADGVMALSKDKTIPDKQQQIVDSILRIKKQPKEIWMVKLADRITNLQLPPQHWKKQRIESYRDEALYILEQLGSANKMLHDRLLQKINDYSVYI